MAKRKILPKPDWNTSSLNSHTDNSAYPPSSWNSLRLDDKPEPSRPRHTNPKRNIPTLHTKIHFQNIDQGTETIKSVQTNNDQYKVNPANCTVTSENTNTIKQGFTAEITINHPYDDPVHIKVICEDGTSHESDWKTQT